MSKFGYYGLKQKSSDKNRPQRKMSQRGSANLAENSSSAACYAIYFLYCRLIHSIKFIILFFIAKKRLIFKVYFFSSSGIFPSRSVYVFLRERNCFLIARYTEMFIPLSLRFRSNGIIPFLTDFYTPMAHQKTFCGLSKR